MNLFVLLLQVIFTIPLFCILEFFNKKELSNIQKILIPVVYIIILSALCTEIKSNIYLIVIFEVFLHNFYTNHIINKEILVNKKEYFINSIISILLSVFIYDYFISKVDSVIPQAEEFRPLLWFLIIIFLYNLFKNNFVKVEKLKKNNFIDRKREYVVITYAKLKNKYYRIVKSKNILVNRVIYAIMIYENYKNPVLVRRFTNIINRFINKESKYGIMQVESEKEVDDEKSSKLVLAKMDKSYTKMDNKLSDMDKVCLLLKEKYEDIEYINDIIDIYNEIIEFENRYINLTTVIDKLF